MKKHVPVVLLLLFGVVGGTGAAQDQQGPQQAFEAGSAALEAEDWGSAVNEFKAAVGMDPNFEVAHYYLGLSLYRLGDWPGAEAALQRAISLKEERAGSRVALANALLAQGRWQEAAEAVEAEMGLQAPATRAEAMYVLGLVYVAGGDSWRAARELDAALEEVPNFVDVHFALGKLHYSEGEYGAALRGFLRCRELIEDWKEDLRSALAKLVEGRRKPEITEEMVQEKYKFVERFVNERGLWPEVNKALGDTSQGLGEYEEARNYYRDALKRTQNGNPHDTDALTRIGRAYINQAMDFVAEGFIFKPGKYLEAAVTQFERVLDVDPGYAPAHESIGLTYLTEARIYREAVTAAVSPHTAQEAASEFQLALEADPDYLPARINLGEAYLFDKRAQEALKEFETALELAQERGDVKSQAKAETGIAKARTVLGDLDAARRAAEAALKDDPRSPDAFLAYGRVLYLLGLYEQAAQETAKALDPAGRNLEARILLGDVFYAESFWGAATSQYEQAIAQIKESGSREAARQRGELYRKMGECYFAQGDPSMAVTYLNKGLADDPSNYQAERSLAKAYWALRKYYAAQKALEIAASLSPSPAEEADAYFEMGAILEATGDPHEAYLRYSAAVRLDPTNVKAREALDRLRAG